VEDKVKVKRKEVGMMGREKKEISRKLQAAVVVALAILMVLAGAGIAAAEAAISGESSVAIDQALYIIDGKVIGASRGTFHIEDHGTAFRTAAEVFVGDSYKVDIALGNRSQQALYGEIAIEAPEGFSFEVEGKDGATDVVRTGENTWTFTLAAGEEDTTPDLTITVAISDTIKPGAYTPKVSITQVAY